MKRIIVSSLLVLAACSQQGLNTSGETNQSTNTLASIIGGQPVQGSDEIASMTAKLYAISKVQNEKTGEEGIQMAICTTSILSDSTALTAAHCVDADLMLLYFGKDVPADDEAFFKGLRTNPLIRKVTSQRISALWGRSRGEGKNQGDVAVISFKGGLPEGFQPATLIPANTDLSQVKKLTLAGFGQTDGEKKTQATTLMKVNVNVVDMNYSETEMMVSRGACHGDSGGPAYAVINGHTYLVGITHAADTETDPKGVCVSNAIYTKVQPYLTLISKAQQSLDQAARNGTDQKVAANQ